MGGSPFGWGTEIAGSARLPASFHGIYALKVSSGRLPSRGIATSLPGLPVCNCVVAPMAADLKSLKHVTKIVIANLPVDEDPSLIGLPWRENILRDIQYRSPGGTYQPNKPRYTFAVLRHDGHVRPQPPVQRALDITTQALRQQGHEIIDNWEPPSHPAAVQTLFEILGSDGAQGVRDALRSSGEPPVPSLRTWFYEQDTGPRSTIEFWALCQRRADYQTQYEAYWMGGGKGNKMIDAVLLPVVPTAGARENGPTYFAYSAVVNFLDYTAAAFPVTFAHRDRDPKPTRYSPLSPEDQSVWQSCECRPFRP